MSGNCQQAKQVSLRPSELAFVTPVRRRTNCLSELSRGLTDVALALADQPGYYVRLGDYGQGGIRVLD
jgi:hypothetical protein